MAERRLGPLRLGRDGPAQPRAPRPGVGRAVARPAPPVRDADARGRPGGPVVDDDPAQARRLSGGVRGFEPERVAAFGPDDVDRLHARPRDRPQPRQDRVDDRQRAGGRCALEAVGRRLRRPRLVVRRRATDRRTRSPSWRIPAETAESTGDVEGPQEARLPLRRPDDLLLVHAGGRPGQRPRTSTASGTRSARRSPGRSAGLRGRAATSWTDVLAAVDKIGKLNADQVAVARRRYRGVRRGHDGLHAIQPELERATKAAGVPPVDVHR